MRIAALVLVSFVVGIICSVVASRRGRNPNVWFVIGFALNLLAIPLAFYIYQQFRNKRDSSTQI